MITTALAADGVVIHIAGRLEAADLPVLRGVLDRESTALEIELSQLPAADDDAIAFLRRCREVGITVSGASPYVRLLLDVDDEDAPPADTEGGARR